jgi:hypothetical protein
MPAHLRPCSNMPACLSSWHRAPHPVCRAGMCEENRDNECTIPTFSLIKAWDRSDDGRWSNEIVVPQFVYTPTSMYSYPWPLKKLPGGGPLGAGGLGPPPPTPLPPGCVCARAGLHCSLLLLASGSRQQVLQPRAELGLCTVPTLLHAHTSPLLPRCWPVLSPKMPAPPRPAPCSARGCWCSSIAQPWRGATLTLLPPLCMQPSSAAPASALATTTC